MAVYDYGADAAGPFIVMELVDGEDLATILRGSGALPPRQAARIGSAVARALAAAHAAASSIATSSPATSSSAATAG